MDVADHDFAPLLNSADERGRGNYKYRRRSYTYYPRRGRLLVVIAAVLIIGLILIAFYQCPGDLCAYRAAPTAAASVPQATKDMVMLLEDTYRQSHMIHTQPVNLIDYHDVRADNFQFDMNGSDVMVFLHIQKTGGTTFGKHLVQDIDLEDPCQCRMVEKRRKWKKKKSRQYGKKVPQRIKCECLRPGRTGEHWLFSRFSSGWKCGLHPDWTELTGCVDQYLDHTEGHPAHGVERRYFYVSFLRDPVSRFLSEFKHVQRGATWKTAVHMCNGRPPSHQELPDCYSGPDWKGVGIEEFMSCESNLAINRQTRMLADLRLVNCYNKTGMAPKERDKVMLESAKENLLKMAFFGLTELQAESQYIFQETFNLKFKVNFFQHNRDHASKVQDRLPDQVLERIAHLNHLDVQLYDFAKSIMTQRFEDLKASDTEFAKHFDELSEETAVHGQKAEEDEDEEEVDDEDSY